MLSSLYHVSEIAITSNSFLMILRNSRSFSTLQGTSAREKCGEFTASYLMLRNLCLGRCHHCLEYIESQKD